MTCQAKMIVGSEHNHFASVILAMVVNSGPGIARVEQRSPIEVHPLAFQPVDDFLKPLCSLANSQALSSGSRNICHRTPVLEVGFGRSVRRDIGRWEVRGWTCFGFNLR
jgi:hypothetical protein